MIVAFFMAVFTGLATIAEFIELARDSKHEFWWLYPLLFSVNITTLCMCLGLIQ